MDHPTFEYFQGPATEMADLLEGENRCSICGETGTCFSLHHASYKGDRDGKGCLDCLRKGRFFFPHETEAGSLTGRRAALEPLHPRHKVPEDFNRVAFAALLKTPQFITWQGELWLTHCDDFMIYLGEWKPRDFETHANDGDSRRLFLEMTDEDMNHLWDAAIPDGAEKPSDWYATYYAFKCKHCGKLRGNWDCP